MLHAQPLARVQKKRVVLLTGGENAGVVGAPRREGYFVIMTSKDHQLRISTLEGGGHLPHSRGSVLARRENTGSIVVPVGEDNGLCVPREKGNLPPILSIPNSSGGVFATSEDVSSLIIPNSPVNHSCMTNEELHCPTRMDECLAQSDPGLLGVIDPKGFNCQEKGKVPILIELIA